MQYFPLQFYPVNKSCACAFNYCYRRCIYSVKYSVLKLRKCHKKLSKKGGIRKFLVSSVVFFSTPAGHYVNTHSSFGLCTVQTLNLCIFYPILRKTFVAFSKYRAPKSDINQLLGQRSRSDQVSRDVSVY